ncbi:MAG TPA: methionine/alanine import family NSS transporter small subunit [Halanaerobiales bacterium]|nr:methionine/alanine import family NSS transporter small subunit [Halanaerobiales bacterium]
MSTSAIIMLIFAVTVIYGGLFVTIRKALKSSSKKPKDNNS